MKKKYIVFTAILAVVLACALGGWALTSRPTETPEVSPVPTVSPIPKVLPEFNSSSPSPSVAPTSTPPSETPAPEETQSGDATVTRDEQGNETIKPNWSTDKLPEGVTVVPRQAETNMGGGGGTKMPTDKDGVYRGDHPGQSPAPTAPSPSPAPTTPSTAPSPEPSSSPAPTTPSTPGGPPTSNGKNGEISPDGKYGWVDGFGWVERGGSDGGQSGNDYDPNAKLSGEKVGDM